MPAWLIEVIGKSPVVAVVAVIAYFGYRTVKHIVDSPLSIAALFGVLGGRQRRIDAREMARILCDQPGPAPAVEGPRRRPPRRRRGRRRRRIDRQ